MVLTAQKKRPLVRGKKKRRVAIVLSLFNEAINQGLLKGCLAGFMEHKIPREDIDIFAVAGAFEIPFMALSVARTKRYDGLVVIGSVIRGETPHFEYVSLAVTIGSIQASLTAPLPISFAVLTVDDRDQACQRSEANDLNKGREAALALMQTLATMEKL